MTSTDRRQFLQFTAAAGAAALGGLLPGSIRKAMAIAPDIRHGSIQDVDHVVILMQENRSFDHYFGSLRGVRGFADPRPVNLPNNRSVWHQPSGSADNYVLPFHPGIDELGLQFVEDLPHGWNDTHNAWNKGRHDRWVPSKGTTTMAYLQRQDIPFHYALADAFTICDAYHCSMLSSTDPNRYYMWTGYVGNDGQGGGPVLDNAEKGYGWTTYPERLEQAGISWKIYQDAGDGLDANGGWGWTDDAYVGNYGDNSLLYFNQYRNATPGSALYQKARTGTSFKSGDDYFSKLKRDVLSGHLPQVSWIVAPEAYSEHPNWPANYGAWYVAQVLDALTANPKLWSRTALFVTYDENDGFFDHLPPPHAPASREQGLSTVSTAGEVYPGGHGFDAGPYGLGIRVPMLVISPWSRGGWVNSQVFDHTSIIRFLEQRFGVQEPNISAWRRAVCGDLTSAFDFTSAQPQIPPLPDVAGYAPPDRLRHANYHPVVPLEQRLPQQEPGRRPTRPLPYALTVQGRVEPSSGRYWLDFGNDGRAAAVFQVYAGNRQDGPWTYTVEAGKRLSDYWSSVYGGGRYELSVFGPNGFLSQFHGRQPASDASGVPEVTLRFGAEPDRLWLTLNNHGERRCAFVVTPRDYSGEPPRRYEVEPGASVDDVWEIGHSAHWYDLAVSIEGDTHYLRRFAGHRETGAASLSDPALSRDERKSGDASSAPAASATALAS